MILVYIHPFLLTIFGAVYYGFPQQVLSQKLAREIVSRIQKLRKKSGLQVGESVEVRCPSPALLKYPVCFISSLLVFLPHQKIVCMYDDVLTYGI